LMQKLFSEFSNLLELHASALPLPIAPHQILDLPRGVIC